MSRVEISSELNIRGTEKPNVHTVAVGGTTHKFKPGTVTASVGDIVVFEFYPSNHSVVRAQYGHPCIPFEDLNQGRGGFFSGFYAVSNILSNPPTWNLTIDGTSPIFFYCSAPGSCIDYQMVGVINPNSSVSLLDQQQLAKDSDFMLQPGEAFPSEASASVSSLPSSTSASQRGNGRNLSTIAGMVAGVVAAAILVVGIAIYYLPRRQKKGCGKSSLGQTPHPNNNDAWDESCSPLGSPLTPVPNIMQNSEFLQPFPLVGTNTNSNGDTGNSTIGELSGESRHELPAR